MGKWAFVTGATSTIGRAVALNLAQAGWDILAGVRDLTAADQLCEEIRAQGVSAETFAYDLSNPGSLAETLGSFLTESGLTVSVFVHAAGMTEILPIRNLSYVRALEIMNINFLSAQQIISALCKKKNNQGALRAIIFISAMIAQTGARYQSLYCASKAALDSLADSLAVELAPGVRVNTVLPGSLRSKMAESAFQNPETLAHIESRQILGSGLPEDVSDMVGFLLSDQAKWVTGQHIRVDGGEALNG